MNLTSLCGRTCADGGVFMTATKTNAIKMVTGYYEHNLCIDGEVIYSFDGDISEFWFIENPRASAEMYVENILTEFRENYNQNGYDLVSENKDEIINVMTEYIANWIA